MIRWTADGRTGRRKAEGSLVGACVSALSLDPGCSRVDRVAQRGRLGGKKRGTEAATEPQANSFLSPGLEPGFFMRSETLVKLGSEPFRLNVYLTDVCPFTICAYLIPRARF